MHGTPTRVLFDAHHIGSGKTGNETYARELLRALRGRAGLHLTAAVVDSPSDPALEPPIAVRRVPRNGWLRLLALGIAGSGMDLVHSMYYLPLASRRPTVVSIHDVSYERHPEFFGRLEVLKNRVLVREAARRATMVVTLSEHARSEMIELYGLDPHRVAVVPGGVSEAFHAPDEPRAPTADRTGVVRILAVGTLQPRKNLLRLLDAVRIVGLRERVQLRVIGPPGHAADEIRARLGNGADVVLLGYVPDHLLLQEYRAADIFVYPSIYEGFGLPIVEAMACGTPVVTTTGGSLPEVAGDAALIVDPYDVDAIARAIAQLIDDPSLRRDLVARGRSRAAEYTWRSAADRLVAVYERVLGA
jgi:glycosyltransferase involved in cell wall biosynthesis